MINRGGQTVKRNLEKGVDILEYLNIIILETDDEVSDMSDPTALYEEKAELLKPWPTRSGCGSSAGC